MAYMKDLSGGSYSRQIRNVLIFIGVVIALYVLKIAHEVTLPIAVALFLFCFTNPVMDKLTKLKIPSIIALILVLALVVVIYVAFVYVIFLMVNMLVGRIDYYAYRINYMDVVISDFMREYVPDIPDDFRLIASLNVDWLSIAKTSLANISSKVMTILSDSMLIFITLMFLLLERTTFIPKIMVAFPMDKGQRLISMMGRINKQISKYLFIKAVISALTGLFFYLASILVGLDFALVWGVLAFILNFIPTIGSIIVTAMTILMAVIQFFPQPMPIVAVALMTIATQMVLGNIIDPRLQGVQLNISPFIILVSLSLWGYIWGITGMFLAVPLTSILQISCAIIPSLRPIAIFLSAGKNYGREFTDEEIEKQKKSRRKKKTSASEEEEKVHGDIILPEKSGRKSSDKRSSDHLHP